MVDIIFHEERIFHFFLKERLVIGKSDDVFRQLIFGGFELCIDLVVPVIPGTGQEIIQIQRMVRI